MGNRGTPRRITAMGYVGNNAQNGVWMTLNGGQMALAGASANTDVEPAFSGVSIDSGGYGILDCDYRTPQEAWAVGAEAPCIDRWTAASRSSSTRRRTASRATCTRSSSSTTRRVLLWEVMGC